MTIVREEFVTADLGEAESYIAQNYGNVDLTAHELTFSETSVGDDRFALRDLRISGGYSAECALEAVIVVQSDAGYRWEVDGVRGDATAPVLFQPGGSLACQLEDTDVNVVVFPLAALTELARTVYNDASMTVRFDDNRLADASLASAWRAVTTHAFHAVPALHSDLVRASIFRSLAVTALEAFALRGDRQERVESVRQQQQAYRTATAFLDDHASLPITVDDAAASAGVSTAALNRAFQSHSVTGQTAAEYLWAVRLDAAHSDLLAADLGGSESVARIAARWGFTERSLTARHARVYGYLPQDLIET
jgi:AraC-like DNA-binding protein